MLGTVVDTWGTAVSLRESHNHPHEIQSKSVYIAGGE
jgi:hypothetical protein